MKCVITSNKYTIFGYEGKQVRDNIHSKDLVNAFMNSIKNQVLERYTTSVVGLITTAQ